MRTLKYTGVVLFALFANMMIVSCDKVAMPYPEAEDTAQDTTSNDSVEVYTRKVLLEEYTGHQCGNCPAAGYQAEQMQDTYGEQLIVIAIHSGFYARTESSGDKYLTDHSNADSDAIYGQWTPIGTPYGMINRGDILVNQEWEADVTTELAKDPEVKIMVTPNYNSGANSVAPQVDVVSLVDQDRELYVVAAMLEDSLVDWQKIYASTPVPGYPTGDVEDFVHRHMLRGHVNGNFGQQLINASFPTGDTTSVTMSAKTLGATWDINHMELVVYVYDMADWKIIQAEIVHLDDSH